MNCATPPIPRWSFSALKQFEKCPFSVYLQRVDHAPQPDRGEDHPLERGNRIHKEAECFVKGEGPLTTDLKKIRVELEKAREAYPTGCIEVEQRWGYDQTWAQCEWKDPNCWAMIKCDLVWHEPQVLVVDDYKSGKRYGKEVSHGQQMQIYAMGGFFRYPEANLVKTRLLYSDEGKIVERTYTRPQVLEFVPRVEERAKRLTTATAFPPKPNRSNCKYCDFGVVKGTGVCPYAIAE